MSAFLTWDVALMNLFSDMTCRRCRSHPINEAVMLMTRQRSTTIAWQREEQRQQCWDKQHGFGLAVMRNPVRGTPLCWPVSKRHPLKCCVDQPSPSTVSSWAHSEFTLSVTLKMLYEKRFWYLPVCKAWWQTNAWCGKVLESHITQSTKCSIYTAFIFSSYQKCVLAICTH